MRALAFAAALALTFGAASAAPKHVAHHARRPAAPPLTRPVLSGPEVSTTDLLRYAAWRERFKPKDQFDAAPSEADLVGKSFTLTLPVKQNALGGEGADATYDANSQVLQLSVSSALWNRSGFILDLPDVDVTSPSAFYLKGFYVSHTMEDAGEYLGSNAFGATRRVQRYSEHTVGIAAMGDGGNSPWPEHELEKSLKLAPDKARDLVRGARLVLTGKLVAFAPNRVTACGNEYSGATLDDPYESSERVCVFDAQLDHIAVVASDGSTVADWSKATDKPYSWSPPS